jgi:hypothetical protein
MTASKRLLLAFGCTVLGVSTIGIFGVVRSLHYGLRYGLKYVGQILQILPVYLIIALAGWVIAIPFVLAFKSARGVQGWLTLCIGTIIGPAFLTAWLEGHINWLADGSSLVLSAAIGCLTTVFYVLLLRRMTPQEAAFTTGR